MPATFLNIVFRPNGKVYLNGTSKGAEYILVDWSVGKANELEVIGYYKYDWVHYTVFDPKKLAKIKPEYIRTGTFRKWPRFWEKEERQYVPELTHFELVSPLVEATIVTNWSIRDFVKENIDD